VQCQQIILFYLLQNNLYPQKMNEYSKRLKKAMDYANLTQEESARKSGVKQQTIQYLLKKGRSSRYNSQIAHACGVNTDWLATGKGEMLTEQTTQPFPHNDVNQVTFNCIPAIQVSIRNSVSLPVIYKQQIQKFEVPVEWAKSRLTHATSLQNVKIITSLGDAMDGTINHGALVFVDSGIRVISLEGVYAIRAHTTGQLYLRRIFPLYDNKYKVINDNKHYPSLTLKEEELLCDYCIEGKVIGAMNFGEM